RPPLPSGLVARGARLVTDDVLAVDLAGSAVTAHRGAAVARLDPAELRAFTPGERDTLGPVRARGEKWHVAPPLAPERPPLGLTYHLVRPATTAAVEIVPVRPYDPALLLGSAFLPYLTDPERLRRQLDVCAAVAASTPLHQVRVPARTPAADVADAVLRHAEALVAEGG